MTKCERECELQVMCSVWNAITNTWLSKRLRRCICNKIEYTKINVLHAEIEKSINHRRIFICLCVWMRVHSFGAVAAIQANFEFFCFSFDWRQIYRNFSAVQFNKKFDPILFCYYPLDEYSFPDFFLISKLKNLRGLLHEFPGGIFTKIYSVPL